MIWENTHLNLHSKMVATFTITCYGKTKTYKESQRNKLAKEYKIAMLSCDGSEAERYSNIYQDLVAGEKECMDIERPLTPEMEELLTKMFVSA